MEASRSRSAPALPHAYNLRQYSTERGRLAQAAPGAAEVKLVHPLSQIDLVGGNGRWRQKRAKEQWVIDQAEAEKQRREQQILEDPEEVQRNLGANLGLWRNALRTLSGTHYIYICMRRCTA
ncbi:unnamed protein product [Prorocentrum cordatum]|uniref:Pre-mRNA-splicing factor SLU7 n=1 Tax=Prorocentrum cordatum TaxID=2364126 RepID=A0ABN9XB79_9DINO|nr:unnamed protein product [Polarella glacialis]